jgi:hypothetical protein
MLPSYEPKLTADAQMMPAGRQTVRRPMRVARYTSYAGAPVVTAAPETLPVDPAAEDFQPKVPVPAGGWFPPYDPTASSPAVMSPEDVRSLATSSDPYEQAQIRLRQEMNAPLTDDRRGSMLYGAVDAASREARSSNSLGRAFGAALAGLAGGAIDKKLRGRALKEAAVAKAKEMVGVEGALKKEERESENDALDRDLKKSQAEYNRARPGIEAGKANSVEMRSRRTAAAQMFNDLDKFDPEDPKNSAIVEQMRELGLPIMKKDGGQQVKLVQDMKTGTWYSVVTDKGTGASSASTVAAPAGGGQLATTTSAAITSEDKQKDRELREQLNSKDRELRKYIADQQAGISREKTKLSADQFSKRYPGAGQYVTKDFIIKQARELKMLPEDVAKDAIRQGFQIQ